MTTLKSPVVSLKDSLPWSSLRQAACHRSVTAPLVPHWHCYSADRGFGDVVVSASITTDSEGMPAALEKFLILSSLQLTYFRLTSKKLYLF